MATPMATCSSVRTRRWLKAPRAILSSAFCCCWLAARILSLSARAWLRPASDAFCWSMIEALAAACSLQLPIRLPSTWACCLQPSSSTRAVSTLRRAASLSAKEPGFGIRGSGFGMRRELFQAADLEDLSARSIRGRHGYASAGEIPLWIGLELLDAPFRAEVIRRPLMLDMAGGARRIDAHSAHRINVGVCHFRVSTGSGRFRRRARMRSDARSTRASRSPPRAR